MQRYIVSYDISKDKIRGRAYRKLKKIGISIQKSVFYVELNYSELVRLQKDMMDLIEVTDSVFIVPCCDRCFAQATYIGKQKEVVMVA